MTDIFNLATCMNGYQFIDALNCLNRLTDSGQGGILGIIILIIVGGTLFFMSKSWGNERAFGVSFFITGLLAILIRIIGLINDATVAICVLLAIFGFILLMREAAPYET